MTCITRTTGKKTLVFLLPVVAIAAAVTLLFSAISGSAMGLASLQRVSTGTGGGEGNYSSKNAVISSNGDWVAFESLSSNLVSGDTNGFADVFLKDTASGGLERISVSSGGTQATSSSGHPSLSSDGRYVAFDSAANNLVSDDSNGVQDVFFRDNVTGTVQRISTSTGGTGGTISSAYPAVSANGDFVTFESGAATLVSDDTNARVDVFRKDTGTGDLIRVSTGTGGVESNHNSANSTLSADGRYVAFESLASNIGASTDDTNGQWDIYVKDLSTGETEFVSVAFDGSPATGSSNSPSISADGRYVAFHSLANNIVTPDTNGVSDVFVRDQLTDTTVRVSTTDNGVAGNLASENPALSPDGRFVVFSSTASNLTGPDINGFADIFIKDIQTGNIILLSPGNEGAVTNNSSAFPSVSNGGGYAVFESAATNLAGGDSNNEWDIFRATVDQVAPVTTANILPAAPDGAAGWYLDPPSLGLTSSESGDSQYQWDSSSDSGWQSFGGPLDAPAGTHTLYYRSADTADNTEDVKSRAVKVDTANPSVPGSIGSSHLAGSAYSDPTVSMNWSAASDLYSSVDGYSFKLTKNASEVPDTVMDAEESVLEMTSSALGEGRWYFRIKSKDNAGRWGTTATYGPFIVDMTDPYISFGSTAKASGAFIRGTITLPSIVTDSLAGIGSVTLMDGTRALTSRSLSPYSFNLYTRALSNGTHTIGLRASDKAGNQSTVTRTYKIDNYPPRTAAPYAATIKRYSYVKLYYKVTDPYSPQAQVKIVIKNSAGRIMKTVHPGWRGTGTLRYHSYYESLPRGTYYFYIYATDKAGNTQINVAKNKLVIK